eukprot:CAMPEP_0175102324 /NCGR_PEP_ID=MMETSP0086_2-20121207/8367_1 /TAXON_ID=136419 /ORGANISM="Unknown Unknown, Strain D1" /LENGTH=223 /DNA_ID=CAMNT_0016377109 /DNA_START=33 /DNA_END=704 /DNA_ORIENTATION=+
MTSDSKDNSSNRLPYYSAPEVALHNVSSDCWVSYFGKVYDLTPLVQEHRGLLVNPILKFAGQDISHWFDARTLEPRNYVHPELGVEVPFTPYGRYVHIPPPEPVIDWMTHIPCPWWRDTKYLIGNLSKKQRKIKVVNVLSGQTDEIPVCAEETLEEIRQRYLTYNAHALSYTWKRLGRPLNMALTLEDNGVPDESEEFAALSIDEDQYIPAIHIYFNDDLTVK